MGNGSWNTSSGAGGGYNGSYGGGGNGFQGFPYPGGDSGWQWSGSDGCKGSWGGQSEAWYGGAGGKGNGWDNGWGDQCSGGAWNDSMWGSNGHSNPGNGHSNGVPAGKGQGKNVASEERKEFERLVDSAGLNGPRKEQDCRINGNGHAQGHFAPDARERAQPSNPECAFRIRPDNASNSGDSDNGDPLPPGATEAEIEEARVIVEKAQRQLVERNKMKEAATTASRGDLQAMINKRLAQK